MNITTLQLVDATPLGATTPTTISVVGNLGGALLDGFEVCDMTLDANLARQPKQSDPNLGWKNAPIKADGVNLWGQNIKIRRVRVINWGAYSSSNECFPLYIEGGSASGGQGENVIEDCIIEQPDFSPIREATLVNTHSHQNAPNVLAIARNNYINGDFTTGSPPPAEPVVLMTEISTEVIVKTKWPHGILDGEKVLISGSSVSQLNDRFVTRYVSETEFGIPKPFSGVTFGGNPWAQRFVPKAMRVSLARVGTTTQVTVTTPEPHWRKIGDWVRIAGATINSPAAGTPDIRYFVGSFTVESVPSATTFTYRIWESPVAGVALDGGDIWLDRWPSDINIIPPTEGSTLGLRAYSGGTGLVKTTAPHFRIPGDSVLISGLSGTGNSLWNGYWRVTSVSSSRDLACYIGAPGLLDVPNTDQNYAIAAIRYNFQGFTAIVPYGAKAYGNRLVGLNRGGPYHDLGPAPVRESISYNNYYYSCYVGQQSAIQDQNNREYTTIAHDNVIDLRDFSPSTWNQEWPLGIVLAGPNPPLSSDPVAGTYAFGFVRVYDNYVRFVNGASGAGSGEGHVEAGINVRSARQVLVQENIITLPLATTPLAVTDSGAFLCQMNRENNGTLDLNYP